MRKLHPAPGYSRGPQAPSPPIPTGQAIGHKWKPAQPIMRKARPNRGRPLVRVYDYAPSERGTLHGWYDVTFQFATFQFANGRCYEYPGFSLEDFEVLVMTRDRELWFHQAFRRPPGGTLPYNEVATPPAVFDLSF
jgi:hypothetical protein